MLSSVFPAMTECTPQELLPIMPPSDAAVVSGWVGAERQVMLLGGVAEVVKNDSGLHSGGTAARIDFHDLIHVACVKSSDHGDIAALSGERSSGAAA